jgi:hypothetical protein
VSARKRGEKKGKPRGAALSKYPFYVGKHLREMYAKVRKEGRKATTAEKKAAFKNAKAEWEKNGRK